MLHQLTLAFNYNIIGYQVNELVNKEYRKKVDLRTYESDIRRVLHFIFGEELKNVIIEQQFYAYKLKKRISTRKEKVQLGRMIVRNIPQLNSAIKSYPLRYPEHLRTCRRLFQCMKAKGRLAEATRQIQ